MNRLHFILLSLLALLFSACSKDDNDTPSGNLLSISNNLETFGINKSNQTIRLTAEQKWSITGCPNWLSLDKTEGETSTDLNLEVDSNLSLDERTASLIIESGTEKILLQVKQRGASRNELLQWRSLQLGTFEDVQYKLDENNIERTYSFKVYEQFITPTMKNKIFVGNLVDSKLDDKFDIKEYNGYTFNPITVSTLMGNVETYIPSKKSEEEYVKAILKKNKTQNESFSSNSGIKYYSHRELNLIGLSNVGVALDEEIAGKSYKNMEMKKKGGVIFSFSQTIFSITMDYPDPLIKEIITKTPENADLSYISSVSYGRFGLLIAESDSDSEKLRKAVLHSIQNQTLNTEENEILLNSDFYLVKHNSSQNISIIKGGSELISIYKGIGENLDNIYPISFNVTNFFGYSMQFINFSLRLE